MLNQKLGTERHLAVRKREHFRVHVYLYHINIFFSFFLFAMIYFRYWEFKQHTSYFHVADVLIIISCIQGCPSCTLSSDGDREIEFWELTKCPQLTTITPSTMRMKLRRSVSDADHYVIISELLDTTSNVLRFPLPIFIPPVAPQSPSSIIWGLYNGPEVAAVPSTLTKSHNIDLSSCDTLCRVKSGLVR
jgi:hypothetical protein